LCGSSLPRSLVRIRVLGELVVEKGRDGSLAKVPRVFHRVKDAVVTVLRWRSAGANTTHG
jgi:hypothetical protein